MLRVQVARITGWNYEPGGGPCDRVKTPARPMLGFGESENPKVWLGKGTLEPLNFSSFPPRSPSFPRSRALRRIPEQASRPLPIAGTLVVPGSLLFFFFCPSVARRPLSLLVSPSLALPKAAPFPYSSLPLLSRSRRPPSPAAAEGLSGRPLSRSRRLSPSAESRRPTSADCFACAVVLTGSLFLFSLIRLP